MKVLRYANKKIIIIFVIFAAVILLGIALGFYYSSLPEHHPQKNKQFCESAGGEWSDNQKNCLLSDKKAGEICTDGAQCESGVCFPPVLTEEQKTTLANKPINNIVGTCYANNFPTGCVKQIIMGTISKKSMCLDD
ncbi:MAG: hypothetical protein WCV70_04860 [Patescibacteria group bacterium]|jgi:hypothetical protein